MMEQEIKHSKPEKKARKKDYIANLMIAQVVICCIIFSIVFILQKSNTRMFNEIKSKFLTVMAASFTKDDAVQTFKELSDYIFMPVSELTNKNNVTETVSEEITSEEEGITVTEIEALGKGGEDIDKLAASSKASFAQYYISGKITVPVHGEVSSPYGYRIHPITGNESFHGGIDIAAKEGTRISAAYYGEVIETGCSEAAGNYIVMKHGDGVKTLYMHCSKILVEEGNIIRSGETIGLVGSTGMSTGPHLHFEIRINNIRHDPAYILPIKDNAI